MKSYLLIFILISNFLFIYCDDEYYYDYEGNPNNINIESISYELTYNNYSVVKVSIKTYDQIRGDISFTACLKSVDEQKEYKLNCVSSFYDTIDCYSEKNVTFNLNDKYTFYYNHQNSKYTFDENDVLEDDKQVSLIFKPEISIEDKLYKDNKKIVAITGSNMVSGGNLYITKKSKKIFKKPKDGFNKYADLYNIIPNVGYHEEIPLSTLAGYKKAISMGYHIVKAVLRFTHDKVPVISHEEKLDLISNGKGKISDYTLTELLQFDYGSKIDKKYKGEKIISLKILLELCKEMNTIIDLDLSQLNYKKYFEKEDTNAQRIIDTIRRQKMLDSVIFSDGPSGENIFKLMEIKRDIVVSIQSNSTKESFDAIKKDFHGTKRIIYGVNQLNDHQINEKIIKHVSFDNNKIKVGIINDFQFAKKLFSWGVNYIVTNELPPFIAENKEEEPIIIDCYPIDSYQSECDIEDDIILRDNEWYNIYYSENIYNVFEDINEEPIGEFQYVDTNLLDELYYKINQIDLIHGKISLNLSEILKKGEEITGIIGPHYDKVSDMYQYEFICRGNDDYCVECFIQKEEEGKAKFRIGHYSIYSVEDYSLNEDFVIEEITENEETYYEFIVEKKRPYFLIFCFIVAIIICVLIVYYVKYKKRSYSYNRIRIADNNYLSDDYLFR